MGRPRAKTSIDEAVCALRAAGSPLSFHPIPGTSKMSPLMARAVSISSVAGLATWVMYVVGLHPWAGLVAWAAFIYAGEDRNALTQTVAATTLGAALGWLAIMAAVSIPIPAEHADWLWIPRQALKVVITLFLAVVATKFTLFRHLTITLLGYAVLFAADATIELDLPVVHLLTAPKLYNPFINGVLSMSVGAAFGFSAKRLEQRLAARRTE